MQVVSLLREAEVLLWKDAMVGIACRELGISEHNYCRWMTPRCPGSVTRLCRLCFSLGRFDARDAGDGMLQSICTVAPSPCQRDSHHLPRLLLDPGVEPPRRHHRYVARIEYKSGPRYQLGGRPGQKRPGFSLSSLECPSTRSRLRGERQRAGSGVLGLRRVASGS